MNESSWILIGLSNGQPVLGKLALAGFQVSIELLEISMPLESLPLNEPAVKEVFVPHELPENPFKKQVSAARTNSRASDQYPIHDSCPLCKVHSAGAAVVQFALD